MQDNLFALLYTSTMAMDQSPTCVADILRMARRHNSLVGITGLLVFDGQSFCQYLEGPQGEILNLVERIRRDKRHVDFAIQEQRELAGPRRFADWNMAYALATNEDDLRNFGKTLHISPIALLEMLLPSLSLEPKLS